MNVNRNKNKYICSKCSLNKVIKSATKAQALLKLTENAELLHKRAKSADVLALLVPAAEFVHVPCGQYRAGQVTLKRNFC